MSPLPRADLSTQQWWVPSEWGVNVALTVPAVGRAVAVLVLTVIVARLVQVTYERATRGISVDPNLRLVVQRVIVLMIALIGALTVLDILGIPLSTLVTVLGVAGIGISLALQDILKNFFAGTYMLFERPFRIGDRIAVKDFQGRVVTIGIRTTTLLTEDNVEIRVPNSMMFTEAVHNRTNQTGPPEKPVD
jgi:small-conductance mechanosensitive channel